MFRNLTILLFVATSASAQDGAALIRFASQTMGADKLQSVRITATGRNAVLGQNLAPDQPWPMFDLASYRYTVNYRQQSAEESFVRVQGNNPPRGGFVLAGEQAQANYVNEQTIWNLAANGTVTVAANATWEDRAMQILLTPHGFLNAAAAGQPTIKSRAKGERGTVISVTVLGKFPLEGTIGSDGLLQRVETRLPNPVLGDMPVVVDYSDYREFRGIPFPTRVIQKQGGYPVLDLRWTNVEPNVAAEFPIPALPTATAAGPLQSEKIADGVWYTAGPYHSTIVEFRDHLLVFDAPQGDERSAAVIAEAKRVAPGKPIRYLLASHHHFDHSGGARAYVAEGATVITQKINRDFFNEVWKAPRTLSPDRLSANPRKPSFISVDDRYTLNDGSRTMEIYRVPDSTHHLGMLIAYLPKEKILIEADLFDPPGGIRMGNAQVETENLYRFVQSLKLDIDKIASVHGRLVTMQDLAASATGK
jgi:glyoxylase-like metal-dependent hydrolase (beta-lactamase superfamily II)